MLYEASQVYTVPGKKTVYYRLNKGMPIRSIMVVDNNKTTVINEEVTVHPSDVRWMECFKDTVPYDVYNKLHGKV